MTVSVCIKQVPDVEAPFRVQDGELIFDTDRVVLNAYDASAVEGALTLKENLKADIEIELVTVGSSTVTETLRKALAMGCDRGVHLEVDDVSDYDSRVYAEILSAYYKEADVDAIFCGKQSQDTDAGLTGAMLAELLNLPYATNAVELQLDTEPESIVVHRHGDQGTEIIQLPTPCLVTCSNDMNNPRIPGLKGIMQAKKKPVDTRPAHDLQNGISPATEISGFEPMPEREPGERIEGGPEEVVQTLVERLSQDTNVL